MGEANKRIVGAKSATCVASRFCLYNCEVFSSIKTS